jgi:rubrerythrin
MPMDTPFYVSAAAAGLAAAGLFYFFTRRGAGASQTPAQGSAFAKYGTEIRLRDVFRLAVMIEEKGEALYLKLAVKASRPETRKLCQWLAEQEVSHKQYLQEQLGKWRALPPHLTQWPAFLEQVRQEGFFESPPGADVGEDQLAAYAIREEIKSAEFYALFEKSFPAAWKRMRMRRLMDEERAHEAALREAYPHIK